MRAVDTNVLVRLLARDDASQLAAAEAFVAGGGWISHVVLVETLWVLESVYERTASQIATAVEMMLAHSQFTLQDADVAESALTRFRRHPALGYSDCMVLEIARKAGHLPLGTFDQRLARIDGAHRVG